MAEIIGSVCVVVLCLIGVTTVLQAFGGWMLLPRKENTMILLIPLRGHCEEAELLLRGAVQRVRAMGGRDRKVLLCVDCGMDEESRAVCVRFCDENEEMSLVAPEEITEYFHCKTDAHDV